MVHFYALCRSMANRATRAPVRWTFNGRRDRMGPAWRRPEAHVGKIYDTMKPNRWPRALAGVVAGVAVALLLVPANRSLLAETAAAPTAQRSAAGTLNVFAAASLTAAFQAEAAQFERDHPGLKVQ